MKKLLLILLYFPLIGFGQGQNPGTAQDAFDINGVNTLVGTGGFMWDLSSAKYEVPKGGGKHSIFAHEFWFGGVDDGGQLKVAAMTYRQSGNDLWAGPCSDSIYHNPANMSDWDRVWKINKTEIDDHILNYNSAGYIIPDAIENWPAHGDTTLGQAFYLAPFIDIDNNGIYNPFLGDYPQIKGDQALYMIRNDVGNIHGESNGAALGIEQHLMFYGYLCIDNPAVNHTLFVNMKIFNRGNHNINDFYLGTWIDPDLGNYLDDYVGCNVEKDLGYVYNGVANDEGANGYSSSGCQSSTELPPPAQGLVYLNQSMSKFMYFNNDASVTGNPSNGQDFYNYLRGIWRDNVPMTFGGDGHGSGTGTTTDLSSYMFPGTTDPAFPGQDWSETTAQNLPSDRRFIMSAGPVDLSTGDVYTLDYAFVFAWDSITPGNTGSVDLLFEYVDTIKAVYQNPGILLCNNPGCTDLSAVNYNPTATLDDGSCCYTGGCKDITAINYDANALCDDGSCNYVGVVLTRLEGTGNGGVALEMLDQSIDDIFNSIEHRVLNPTYKKGQGPVGITIVDSIINYPGKYLFRLDDPVYITNSGGDQTGLITSYGGWSIIDSTNTNVIYSSNQSIDSANKEYVPQLGISVSIGQQLNPGADPINPCNTSNSLISLSSSLEFDDQNDKWLSGVPDRDDPDGLLWGLNWIRSGSYIDDNNALLSDYNLADDPNGVYETAVVKNLTLPLSMGGISYNGGTWAPYSFASDYTHGPGFKLGGMHSYTMSDIEDLPSVDIVFTDDVTKWSRVCIVEAQDDPLLSVGGKLKMELRDAFSVDINGNADLSGTFGMGWFPGYAIDIETGERLNIIFSEDSWLTSENGNDMLWNPTSNVIDTDTNYLLGGKHFIYVLRGESWVKGSKEYLADPLNNDKHSPNYDEGKWIYRQLSDPSNASGRWNVFKNVTWVGVPLLKQGSTINLSNKATVKLRVKKPYKQYETVSYNNFFERSNSSNPSDANDTLNFGSKYTVAYINSTQTWGGKKVVNNGSTYLPGDLFSATDVVFSSSSNKARVIEHESLNSFNPLYSFIIPNDPLFTSTDEFDQEGQLGDLFKVNIYPNPTRQRINISFSSTESQDIEFKIVNNMGQILFSKNLKQFKGDYLKEVLLDKYSKGIYYFHIKTNEGAINKKVIYQ